MATETVPHFDEREGIEIDEDAARQSPERLLPHHITPDEELGLSTKGKKKSPQERHQERREKLKGAPLLEDVLRKQLTAEGKEIPAKVNLSLKLIEGFQRTVEEAQDFRRVVKEATTPQDKAQALSVLRQRQEEIAEFLEYGPSFERAYREYTRERLAFTRFDGLLNERTKLQSMLNEPSFASLPDDSDLGASSAVRVEYVMRTEGLKEERELDELKESLKAVYPENSQEYQDAVRELQVSQAATPGATKKEINERLSTMDAELQDHWENPMVRYFWQKDQWAKILEQFSEGKDVIESPSTIHLLNQLHDIEQSHDRTTIGGVLVGPPGSGKTTLVRHYLEETDRNYVYIDLSEDVTRYLLYGSKSLQFRSPVEAMDNLVKQIESLDDDNFHQFVAENSEGLKDTFRIKGDEAEVVYLEMLQEQLGSKSESALPPEMLAKMPELQKKVTAMAERSYRKELGEEFAHTVKRNGWRDGVIISALRRGDSPILDEFTKNKNWSLLYGLMTAKPGEKWYFADNDEWITIPENWRMYFTANIGRKHNGFDVPEAMASRAEGKVIGMDYPPTREELQVGLSSIATPDGDLVRSEDDMRKMYILIGEIFPKIRQATKDKSQIIPLSYRTIRDLGEKLVQYRDPKTRRPVYTPSQRSFDQALYDVMIASYDQYENKETPKKIAELCINAGLLHDPSLREKVEPMVGKEAYENALKAHAEHANDYKAKMRELFGMASMASTSEIPEVARI